MTRTEKYVAMWACIGIACMLGATTGSRFSLMFAAFAAVWWWDWKRSTQAAARSE